jgi:hypothetical protein
MIEVLNSYADIEAKNRRGVFESMSYFLAHPFLAQIAQMATKQVGYSKAIYN